MFEPTFRNMDDVLRKEASGFDFVMANSASDARSSEKELRRQLIESRAVDVMVAVRNRVQPVMNAELTLIILPHTLACHA